MSAPDVPSKKAKKSSLVGKKRKRSPEGDAIVVIRDEEGELICVDAADGCEVRSEDEDDGEDLKDFIEEEEDEDVIVSREKQQASVTKTALVDVDQSNIVSGKRQRKPVQRYVDTTEFKDQYYKVVIKPMEKELTEEDGEDTETDEEPIASPDALAKDENNPEETAADKEEEDEDNEEEDEEEEEAADEDDEYNPEEDKDGDDDEEEDEEEEEDDPEDEDYDE